MGNCGCNPGARRVRDTSRPVDADVAVQIALLENPRVQSIYSRLGLARADPYDAARLSNPGLGYA